MDVARNTVHRVWFSAGRTGGMYVFMEPTSLISSNSLSKIWQTYSQEEETEYL